MLKRKMRVLKPPKVHVVPTYSRSSVYSFNNSTERRRQLEEEKQVKLRSKEVKRFSDYSFFVFASFFPFPNFYLPLSYRATTPSDSSNHLLATSPTSPKKQTPASPDRPSSAPASSVVSGAAHSPARRKLVLCSGGAVSVSVASAAASPRPSPIVSSSPLKEGTPVGSQKKNVEGAADTREVHSSFSTSHLYTRLTRFCAQAELLASWKALKRKGRRSRVRQIEQSDIFSGDEFKHGVGVAARRTIKTKSEKVHTYF
jgi:hypothetical protein